jgi:hypothetical protein
MHSSPSHVIYMPYPSLPLWLDHSNYIAEAPNWDWSIALYMFQVSGLRLNVFLIHCKV